MRGITNINDPRAKELRTGKKLNFAKTPTTGQEGQRGDTGKAGFPGQAGPAVSVPGAGKQTPGLGAYDLAQNPFQSDASLQPGQQDGGNQGLGQPVPGQPGPGIQKPGRFDAFHAYASEQLAGAGFSKRGGDGKYGFVARKGRFKGLTQDEINQKMRQEFGGFNANQRARYEALGRGDDIATGGIRDQISKKNQELMKSEAEGADRLLKETGDILDRENRTGELANLDLGVRTGSVSGTPELKLTDAPRASLSRERMEQFEGKTTTPIQRQQEWEIANQNKQKQKPGLLG